MNSCLSQWNAYRLSLLIVIVVLIICSYVSTWYNQSRAVERGNGNSTGIKGNGGGGHKAGGNGGKVFLYIRGVLSIGIFFDWWYSCSFPCWTKTSW